MNFKFTSHKKEVKNQLEGALDRALMTAGMMAESQAKRNLKANKSVQTGLLRNSITFARGGKSANIGTYNADVGTGSGSYSGTSSPDPKYEYSVYVGTNVEYAPFVELGTSRADPKPYLHPAANTVGKKLEGIIKSEMMKG